MGKHSFSILFLILIFFYTGFTFIGSQITFPLIANTASIAQLPYYDYAGITHVHSINSTGSGSVEEISKAASRAKCQFVIITDLNQFSTPQWQESYKGDVLVLNGGEYGFLGGHLLAYDHKPVQHAKGLGQANIMLNDALSQAPQNSEKGLLIAAHPFLTHHQWPNLNLPGLHGLEIINLDRLWRQKLNQSKLSFLWSLMLLPFNTDLSFLRLFIEPQKELDEWDRISKERAFLGFGGNDATANAIAIPDKSFRFPTYLQSFNLMKTHVLLESELTGHFEDDRKKIMGALKVGSFYISLDIIGNPAGFYFIGSQGKKNFLTGSTLKKNQGTVKLFTHLEQTIDIPHEIALFRNGEKIATSNSQNLEHTVTTAGTYRVTVKVIPTLPLPDGKTWFTWIYSNQIRVE